VTWAVGMHARKTRRTAGDGTVNAYQTQAGEPYLIKYSAPAPDGVGTRQVFVEGFELRRDGATELRTALAEIANGSHQVPSKATVGEYLASLWLPALRLKPSTTASYRKNVRLHVVPHIGACLLTSLTGQQLTALYRKLETEGRADGQGGLSPPCRRAGRPVAANRSFGTSTPSSIVRCGTRSRTGFSRSTPGTVPSRRRWPRARRRNFDTGPPLSWGRF
jgi:hypothetical protein